MLKISTAFDNSVKFIFLIISRDKQNISCDSFYILLHIKLVCKTNHRFTYERISSLGSLLTLVWTGTRETGYLRKRGSVRLPCSSLMTSMWAIMTMWVQCQCIMYNVSCIQPSMFYECLYIIRPNISGFIGIEIIGCFTLDQHIRQ